jgi:hypothetical protein
MCVCACVQNSEAECPQSNFAHTHSAKPSHLHLERITVVGMQQGKLGLLVVYFTTLSGSQMVWRRKVKRLLRN